MENEEQLVICPQCKNNLLDFEIITGNGMENPENFITQYTCESCGHKWQISENAI